VVAFELYYGAAKSWRRAENERSIGELLADFASALAFDGDDAK